MKAQKFRFCALIVLSILLIACNLTNNFARTENTQSSGSEGVAPSSPVGGDANTDPAVAGEPGSLPEGEANAAAAVTPAFDQATRQEVFEMVSQTNLAPDLSQVSSDVIACLANDALQREIDRPVVVTIYDEYPSGQQKYVLCDLMDKLTNTSNENIRVIYDNFDYSENVEKPRNQRKFTIGQATLPQDQIYLIQNLNYSPLDPAQGVTIISTIGFVAFYDRPECQDFIVDKKLFYQVWVPLEYVCKSYLPTP